MMKSATHTAACIALAAALLACGGCHVGGKHTTVSKQMIHQAEARSSFGANPEWLQLTRQPDLFRGVRDRAYAYCVSGVKIDTNCASEQDQAVGTAIGAIELAQAQRDMPDKKNLTPKERALAFDPAIVPRVLDTCWSLYKEHGAADARILSVCLGNLTDVSPLVPVPVP